MSLARYDKRIGQAHANDQSSHLHMSQIQRLARQYLQKNNIAPW